ncbi:MAG: TIGR04282 family arsenosugar biosynthesis glycosyltransferase [Candidatus Tectimicrobiota bacterium]
MEHTAVVIMAKVPQAGSVKTRLCPPLSPQMAAELYQAFLADKITQVGQLHHSRPTLAYTPEDSRTFFATFAPECVLIPQQGAGLGERLIDCFQQCFRQGCTGVLAIDSDTPHLPTEYLQQAVDLIALPQTDVVLGPTEDGGYYLIGLRAAYRELFDDMPWSTAAVLPETVRRAQALGLTIRWLAPWFDIDTVEELRRLQTMLRQLPTTTAPHTRAFLLEHQL